MPTMSRIRSEMRSHSPADLSVPQYRILASIYRGRIHVGEIANHQGVSQPAMSKMVDSLVQKGFIERGTENKDRRQVHLKLTKTGEALYKKVREATQENLKSKLSCLTEREQQELELGLKHLEKLFDLPGDRK